MTSGASGLSRRWKRRDWSGHRENRLLLCDFEPRLADEFGDGGGVEASGVIFDSQGPGGAIETELPDAVDVSRVSQRPRHLLRGRCCVAIDDLHRGHENRIARSRCGPL